MTENENRLAAFDKTHEGEDGFVIDPSGTWVLYSDGARRSREAYGQLGQALCEPDRIEAERRRWQMLFWTRRLEQLVDAFTRAKIACENTTGDEPRFRQHLERLKTLQTQVRSARSKLARLQTQERGYTQSDVDRAWDAWEQFSVAIREESQARQKYESLLLGRSSAGILEKAKARLDEAKRIMARRMEAWNQFSPATARDIVSEELDTQRRHEREHALAAIEV